MPDISASFAATITAPTTENITLMLVTISHAQLPTPIRIVVNTENITSRGNVYLALPFRIPPPRDDDVAEPRVTAEIDNIDQSLTEVLRTIKTAPDVVMEVIQAHEPDAVVRGPWRFKLRSIEIDAHVVRGELVYDDTTRTEKYPAHVMTPTYFPGLF